MNSFKRAVPALAVFLCVSVRLVAGQDGVRASAAEILQSRGVQAGLCTCLEFGDLTLVRRLADDGRFIVHGLSSNWETVARLTAALSKDGLIGLASVEHSPLTRLPYHNNLVNAVICEDTPALLAKGLPLNEILRVLCPNGIACLGLKAAQRSALEAKLKESKLEDFQFVEKAGLWLVIQKPWPSGMDEWTHWNHAPDGNPVSQDHLVSSPNSVRWMAGPFGSNDRADAGELHGTVSVMVSANGRNFYSMSPFAQKSALIARDAFNGTLLWTRVFPYGLWKSNVVASENKVFVATAPEFWGAPGRGEFFALDAATGQELWKIENIKVAGIIYHKGLVFPLNGNLRALDAQTGKEKWASPVTYDIGPYWPWSFSSGLLVDNDQLFIRSPAGLICLDVNNGKPKWAADLSAKVDPKKNEPRLARNGVVLFKGADEKQTVFNAFSEKDGAWLWSHAVDKSDADWVSKGDAWCASGLIWLSTVSQPPAMKGNVLAKWAFDGLDPISGEVKKTVSLPDFMRPDRCFQLQCTDDYMIGNRPMYFLNWKTGVVDRFEGARGQCIAGIVPANGMLYNIKSGMLPPPNTTGGMCACNPPAINGMVAYSAEKPEEITVDSQRLVCGLATDVSVGGENTLDPWPMYRHDPRRSGATNLPLPKNLQILWSQKLIERLAPSAVVARDWRLKRISNDTLTGATIAGGKAFVSLCDSHKLVAVDAANGKPLWSFTAGGRLDAPPAIDGPRCFLGSHDGWVYCLSVKSGELVWRFRAAPMERRIVVSGQVESSWPVIGGPLLEQGLVYVVCGTTSAADGGCYVTALSPVDGKLVWSERREMGKTGSWNWIRGYFAGQADLLASDGKTICIGGLPQGRLELKTGKEVGDNAFAAPRVHLLWSRYSSQFAGSVQAPVAFDGGAMFCGGMHYSDAGATPHDLYARNTAGGGPLWTLKVQPPQRVEALIKSPDQVVAALSFNKADQIGGELWIVSSRDGAKLAAVTLPVAPAFEGLSAAGGRIYVTLQDGTLVCLGEK